MTDEQLGRMHAERLGVEPSYYQYEGTYYWPTGTLPAPINLLLWGRYKDVENLYSALGRACAACRTASGAEAEVAELRARLEAAERERDEARKVKEWFESFEAGPVAIRRTAKEHIDLREQLATVTAERDELAKLAKEIEDKRKSERDACCRSHAGKNVIIKRVHQDWERCRIGMEAAESACKRLNEEAADARSDQATAERQRDRMQAERDAALTSLGELKAACNGLMDYYCRNYPSNWQGEKADHWFRQIYQLLSAKPLTPQPAKGG